MAGPEPLGANSAAAAAQVERKMHHAAAAAPAPAAMANGRAIVPHNDDSQLCDKITAAAFLALGLLIMASAAAASSLTGIIVLIVIGATIACVSSYALRQLFQEQPHLPEYLPGFNVGGEGRIPMDNAHPQAVQEWHKVRHYTGDLTPAEKKELQAKYSEATTLRISMPGEPAKTLEIRVQDMFKSGAQVLVNAANSHLGGGGGIDGAIHEKGGKEYAAAHAQLKQKYRSQYPSGFAEIISSGALRDLHIENVIVVAGPMAGLTRYSLHRSKDELYSCYYNSLLLAHTQGKTSIAFPAISTGIFGYPTKGAAQISLKAWYDFIKQYPDTSLKTISIHFQGDEERLREYERVITS